MKLRFTMYPPGESDYYCELNVTEEDLSLDAEDFASRFLVPCAAVVLAAFEEPWPADPEAALVMLNRGGPKRGLEFFESQRMSHLTDAGVISTS